MLLDLTPEGGIISGTTVRPVKGYKDTLKVCIDILLIYRSLVSENWKLRLHGKHMYSAGLLDRTPESEGGTKPDVKVSPAINKDDRDNLHPRK